MILGIWQAWRSHPSCRDDPNLRFDRHGLEVWDNQRHLVGSDHPVPVIRSPYGTMGTMAPCLVARNGCHSNTTSLAAQLKPNTSRSPPKNHVAASAKQLLCPHHASQGLAVTTSKKVGICWDHQNHQLSSRLSVNDPALLRMNVVLQEAVKPGRALFREQTATSLDKFLDLKSWTKRQLFMS